MSKVHLSLLILLLCVVGCAPAKPLLIDSFEGPINKETVDFGASEGSAVNVTADTNIKMCGNQSLKVEYELKPSGYMWIARGYNLDVKGAAQWLVPPKDIPWRSYNAISVYVYGAKSGGVIAFDIKDAGQEVWRALIDDDFTGWKEVVLPIKNFFVRKDWQPQTATVNEKIDYPIMSYQFEPRLPGKGVYYFDCVTLVNAKGN
jgi:hypothetical protein